MRHTTFEVDLALIGGQDRNSARHLGWNEFVEHWKKALPDGPLRARFLNQEQRLVWSPTWVAPPEWSTRLWPDFANDDSKKAVKHPVTLLHMALRDRAGPHWIAASAAFEFLLGCGVDPNVWPGHGSTALSLACLLPHLPSMSSLLDHGHDFQATLAPDAPVRDQFKGSSLLHRVGPVLAATAGKKKSIEGQRATSALKFLVEFTPRPDALDAQGRSALEMVYQACPSLQSVLAPILIRRQAMEWSQAWDVPAGQLTELDELEQTNRSWASKGRATRKGEPLRFALVEGHDLKGSGPFAARVLSESEVGTPSMWLRVHEIHSTPLELSADEALELGRSHRAHAVVSGKGDQRVWWFFHPSQARAALPARPLSPSVSPARPRF